MLTYPAIRNMPIPKDRPVKKADAHGLYVEAGTNGKKTWRYRFRIDGKETIYTLGSYPKSPPPPAESEGDKALRHAAKVFTLQEARIERDKIKLLVRQGINPTYHREVEGLKAKANKAHTFKTLAEEWVQDFGADWSDGYRQKVMRSLERDVHPKIGEFSIRDITTAHIVGVLDATKKRLVTAAKHNQIFIGGVFRHAARKALIDNDPTYPLRGYIKQAPVEHHPILGINDIGPFLRALDTVPAEFATLSAAKLLWLAGLRCNEVTGAEWSEFDLDNGRWNIPGARMKAKQPHSVPLSNQAVQVLRELQPFTGRGRFLFPHRSDRSKCLLDYQ